MTSQDLCHTSRHFVTRHVMNSSHTDSQILQERQVDNDFHIFNSSRLLLAGPVESGKPGSMKPICYTWVFISHHTDRSLSIVDGLLLLAWRFQNSVSRTLHYSFFWLSISKKLDHGAVVNRKVWLLRCVNDIDNWFEKFFITRLKIESPSTVDRFSQIFNINAVLSTLDFSHQPDAKYPPQ